MENYIVEDENRFYSVSSSKGTQIKFQKDGYFYKINKVGNEGLVEYLVSLVLQYSDIKYPFVTYEYCRINNQLGCRSFNFLSNEVFITMNTLFTMIIGKYNLSEYLASFRTAKERLQVLIELFHHVGISKEDACHYLKTIVQLDLLIENTDRHGANYGIVQNQDTGAVKFAPVFDNGRALKTDRANGCAATISGSFIEQVTAFEFPVKPAFQIDYDRLLRHLGSLDDTVCASREYQFLLNQLDKYAYLFQKHKSTNNITDS